MAYCSSLRPDVRALPLDLAELTFEGIQWLSALPWHVSNCLLRGTVDLRKKNAWNSASFWPQKLLSCHRSLGSRLVYVQTHTLLSIFRQEVT